MTQPVGPLPITTDQLTTLKAQYLPNDATNHGWDDAKITANWTGGIPGTVRAFWYDRVQQTAGYLDVPDPGGTLPITQLHRQAMEMLAYWDRWLLQYGDVLVIPRRVSFGKIKRRYKNRNPLPVFPGVRPYSPYGSTD